MFKDLRVLHFEFGSKDALQKWSGSLREVFSESFWVTDDFEHGDLRLNFIQDTTLDMRMDMVRLAIERYDIIHIWGKSIFETNRVMAFPTGLDLTIFKLMKKPVVFTYNGFNSDKSLLKMIDTMSDVVLVTDEKHVQKFAKARKLPNSVDQLLLIYDEVFTTQSSFDANEALEFYKEQYFRGRSFTMLKQVIIDWIERGVILFNFFLDKFKKKMKEEGLLSSLKKTYKFLQARRN